MLFVKQRLLVVCNWNIDHESESIRVSKNLYKISYELKQKQNLGKKICFHNINYEYKIKRNIVDRIINMKGTNTK